MISLKDQKLAEQSYRNVFLVQNRDWWGSCPYPYDRELDLVLTFDFALLRQVELEGGRAAYLDHLVDPEQMECYNVETYRFFDSWYLDGEGKDIFSYQGVDFGNSLRIYFWNDITYCLRILINLLALRRLQYQQLLVGIDDPSVSQLLQRLSMEHASWPAPALASCREYYFPSFRWMKENISPQGFRQRLGAQLFRALDTLIMLGERVGLVRRGEVDVYVDRYYPTEAIVQRLKLDRRINVVLGSYSKEKGMLREQRLKLREPDDEKRLLVARVLESFAKREKAVWKIEEVDVSGMLLETIREKITPVLPRCFQMVEDVTSFFQKRNLRLLIITSNVGLLNGILLDYCTKKGIPTYFIINGMMLHKFSVERTEQVSFINSYGESIKKHYFGNRGNVVCCGDPRMDRYLNQSPPREINHQEPTIMIGAGGFSNIDLNSYVASEFDFLDDIMQALKTFRAQGRKMSVVLKVRSNGYIDQYRSFLAEYYPEVPVEVYDATPFIELIQRADFYLSIYSGTLFEASLLGIPVLYYKKDTALLNPPYDGNSELVTASAVQELVEKLELFYQSAPLFRPFNERSVMEKYIGPLDGKNLQRNIDFISRIISGEAKNEPDAFI